MAHVRTLLYTAADCLLGVLVAYRSATQAPDMLAPEGCRMSYMWPSYYRQHEFNSSWSAYASRYSLWLYREAEWDDSNRVRESLRTSTRRSFDALSSCTVSPFSFFPETLALPSKAAPSRRRPHIRSIHRKAFGPRPSLTMFVRSTSLSVRVMTPSKYPTCSCLNSSRV